MWWKVVDFSLGNESLHISPWTKCQQQGWLWSTSFFFLHLLGCEATMLKMLWDDVTHTCGISVTFTSFCQFKCLCTNHHIARKLHAWASWLLSLTMVLPPASSSMCGLLTAEMSILVSQSMPIHSSAGVGCCSSARSWIATLFSCGSSSICLPSLDWLVCLLNLIHRGIHSEDAVTIHLPTKRVVAIVVLCKAVFLSWT